MITSFGRLVPSAMAIGGTWATLKMARDKFYNTARWETLRQAVIHRACGLCQVPGCKHAGLVVDHIVSRRNGGSDNLSNLRLLCRLHDNQIKESSMGARKRNGRPTLAGYDTEGNPLDAAHRWNVAR